MNRTSFMPLQIVTAVVRPLQRAIFLSLFSVVVCSSLVYAAPADLDLNVIALNRIIRGAQVPIYADVYNVAAAGADELNYSLYFTLTDSSVTTPVTDTRAADGGASADRWSLNFDSSFAPFGPNNFSATATGQDGTLHSPKTVGVTVQVLDHVAPAMWINGQEIPIREDPIVEPQIAPEQFAATGGGESFAAAAPHILGDPIYPTANMDLDSVSSVGDSEIATDLVPTYGVVADDNPSAGIPWQIYLNGVMPGHHYSKTFILGFSDEDIPGGVPTGSIISRILVTADVDANGATISLVPLYVPEPGAISMMIVVAVFLLRRRG